MSKALLTLCALSLISCGCDNRHPPSSSATSYVQPISDQPIVSIVPIIDNTKSEYDWSLSDELSSEIYSILSQRDQLILNRSSQVRAKATPFLAQNNPFESEFSAIKKGFGQEEFVAFLELIEHEEVLDQNKIKPQDPHTCRSDLNLSMRIRVFDLRGREPKVILQELVRSTHSIPAPFNRFNFYQVSWKDPSFSVSPVGLAHAKFTKEIAERIEDYILTAVRSQKREKA